MTSNGYSLIPISEVSFRINYNLEIINRIIFTAFSNESKMLNILTRYYIFI